MSGIVLTHPAAPAGGAMWLAGGTRVIDLPTPPDRPTLIQEAIPALVDAVGSDAACTLLQLMVRCQHEPTLGWVVQANLDTVRAWNSWGRHRARQAVQDLERAGVLRREQLLTTTVHGRSLRGAGLMLLTPTPPTVPPKVATVPLGVSTPAVSDVPSALPLRSAEGDGLWGAPLSEDAIRGLLGAWGFDGADAALAEYGRVQVSDAVKATAYRMLKGRVGTPGGYARTILTSGDIATPPAGLPPEWLTGDIDLVALVPAINPADALAAARAALDSRAASVMRRWQSLPMPERAELEAELEALLTTTVLLTPAERQRREIDLREGLLAERGLLAELPEN